MKYDFTTFVERAGKDSRAADHVPFDFEPGEGVSKIPMWVADMSFPTAPFIIDAIKQRLETPSFGYFRLPPEYFDAVINWQKVRNGFEGIEPEHIGYENGVLGGVGAAIQAFTTPGDKILIHSPTYSGFTGVLNFTGRTPVHSPLVRDEQGIWRMDFEDMDRKLKENSIHFAIFCSPHNPTGRVWERWETEKAMEIYAANDCVVVSDEIWSDIIMPGYKHIPTQCISEDAKNRTIAFYAPSKTFSLAGLVGSYHIVFNKYLRDRLVRRSDMCLYNCVNVISMRAMIGAYTQEGQEWTDEMNSVIDNNLQYACDFIAENFPGVSVMRPQGTYMLYLDCSEWCREHGTDIAELQKRGVMAGVIWQDGEIFLVKDTIRMNLALPFGKLVEAMNRLKEHAFI